MKTERIDYKGWGVEVQRKAFRRNISIVLKPGKPVQVRASMGTTWHAIMGFLEDRSEWIEKNLQKFAEVEKDLPQQSLKVGRKYPFLGQEVELKVALTPLEKMFFVVVENDLILHLPKRIYRRDLQDVAFAHAALREFYRKQADVFLKTRFMHWVSATGLRPRSLQIKETKSRWGSCHPNQKITLNWRLVVFRPEIIDYVIVHELCHLLEMNHSKRFWQLVERHFSECKTCVREIREQHRQTDFLDKIPKLQPL